MLRWRHWVWAQPYEHVGRVSCKGAHASVHAYTHVHAHSYTRAHANTDAPNLSFFLSEVGVKGTITWTHACEWLAQCPPNNTA